MRLLQKRLALLSVSLLSIVAGCAVVSSPIYVRRPAIPRIEASKGWQLSEGCRVYEFGIRTQPDCDLLTGHGVTIQVTRVRILNLAPGQDNRAGIGIQFQSDQGDWYLSSPFVTLSIAGRSYIADIDQVFVLARGDRPIFLKKLGSDQQRYELPLGEKRFFRLRFSVNQSELRNGFTLRVMGLHKEDEAVQVPIMKFEWASTF